jgi:hypothetical protein
MNYRIQARQRNDIVSDLQSAWDALGLPKGKCPTGEAVAKKDKDGDPWYLFAEETGEYIYVSQTEKPAYPLNVLFNKYGPL